MKNPLSLILVFLILAASAFITESALSQEPEANPSPNVPIISIGCLLPLSGKYKTVGELTLQGILAAAESMPPGTEYRVVIKDIGDSDQMLRSAFQSLSNFKDLSFIIGPMPSLFIPVIKQAVNSAKIPTIVFPLSEEGPLSGPNFIKFYYPLEEQSRVLAEYSVKELGVKSFAVLYPQTSLGKRMKDEFITELRKNGGNTVYEGAYQNRERELGDEALWISSKNPEGVFIADGSSASAELIVELKKNGGLDDVLFVGPSSWNGSLFQDLAGGEIDGFVYRAIFTDYFYYGGPKWESFKKEFEKKFKSSPSYLEYQSYLATKLVLSVDRVEAPGKDLLQKLSALNSHPDYTVIKETDQSVRITPRYLILTIEDGKLSEVSNVR